jgi:aminoglycoside 2''-phosphotransferase
MNVTPEQIVVAVPALAAGLPLMSIIDSGQNSLVFDFGSASFGDPASDVAGLSASYGDDFVDLVARSCPAVAEMRSRSAFYRPAFAAMEALHGLDHDNREALEAGLAALRN